MNLHSSTKRKPSVLSKRIGAVGFTAIAAAMMFSAGSAQAGPAEIKLLNKYLSDTYGSAVTLDTADATQLKAAVTTLGGANTKKLGVFAGEALKAQGARNSNAGTAIGEAILAVTTDATAISKAVGDAAKTAGLGKTANVEEVSAFAQAALSTDEAAIAAAKIAKASKSGVGAILAGRALDYGVATDATADAAKITFANKAFADKALAPAVTEIARYLGDTVVNATTFAESVSAANVKLAIKIAPGVVASNPDDAGVITAKLLNNATLKPTLTKGAALLAKGVSAVADIEQISLVGSAIADQIGAGAVKITQASGIAKTLAQAIVKKSVGVGVNGINKADEIGEVAAYVVGGIVNNAGFTAKAAPKIVLAIVKSAIAGGKTTKKTQSLAPNASYVADVVGSVARTIANSTVDSTIKEAIKNLLTKSTKAIGGKNGAGAIQNAIDVGFANDAAGKAAGYENGMRRSAEDLQAIVDRETEDKNF